MKPLSYISFLFKSVNAHGVHSPFVYAFTEGIYQRQHILAKDRDLPNGDPGKKALKIVFRTISYFKSYKLIVLGEDDAAITKTLRTTGEKIDAHIWFYSTVVPVPGGIDLAFLCGKDKAAVTAVFNELLPQVNNTTVFVLPNPHATPQMETAWEALKKDPKTTVTVDTYHLGLIFFRQGQAKQHFMIRPQISFFLDALLGVRNLWGLLA